MPKYLELTGGLIDKNKRNLAGNSENVVHP